MLEVILSYFTQIGDVINSFVDFLTNLFVIFDMKEEEPTSQQSVELALMNDTLFRE